MRRLEKTLEQIYLGRKTKKQFDTDMKEDKEFIEKIKLS